MRHAAILAVAKETGDLQSIHLFKGSRQSVSVWLNQPPGQAHIALLVICYIRTHSLVLQPIDGNGSSAKSSLKSNKKPEQRANGSVAKIFTFKMDRLDF